MKLTTPVPINKNCNPIDYSSQVVLLGSCFTENIGSKLSYYGFQTRVNPFGIIFNPSSLRILIERAVKNELFTIKDCEKYFSYLAHSDLNSINSTKLITHLNNALCNLKNGLKEATHLFITLGTAWVYRHLEKDIIVANCHKQPQENFSKELLSIESIKEDLKIISQLTQEINPQLLIIYTLSPVRHLKDGFIENQRSKSRLHDAIQLQVENNLATYFPAYEIVMDELRDYRFYARDMIHLNDLGIDYVWSRFRESGINNNTLPQQKAVEKYRKLAQHRATDHEAHLLQIQKMKSQLQSQYPEIKL